ncbi:Methyltransferase-like protein, partial [Operophtera brumata]
LKSDHSLATDSWRMLTKSSSITRGIVFKTFRRYCKSFRCYNEVTRSDLERTRHRKKPAGGSRYLTDKNQDNVQWDEEQERVAKEKVELNSQVTFSVDHLISLEKFPELAPDYTAAPERVYPEGDSNIVSNNEPKESASPSNRKEAVSSNELVPASDVKRTIFEIGCGVGNTIFPILQYSRDPNLFIYGCDFSSKAIEIMKQSELYDTKRCNVFVLDATQAEWDVPFEENSLDIVVLIFVLSAIDPAKMPGVISKIHKYLKPGGLLVFRDYGKYDLAQLRFKKGRCISDNFYARGDNTRVYFFTQEEITQLFKSAGFSEEQNLIDRRLQVNRGKMLTMYRVWIQAKYRKPL